MSLLKTIKTDLDFSRKDENKKLLNILIPLYSESAMIGKTKRNGDSTDEEVVSVIKKFKVGLEEIKTIIDKFVDELEYKTIKSLGTIMGKLKASYNGLYDGKVASDYIKEVLK